MGLALPRHQNRRQLSRHSPLKDIIRSLRWLSNFRKLVTPSQFYTFFKLTRYAIKLRIPPILDRKPYCELSVDAVHSKLDSTCWSFRVSLPSVLGEPLYRRQQTRMSSTTSCSGILRRRSSSIASSFQCCFFVSEYLMFSLIYRLLSVVLISC